MERTAEWVSQFKSLLSRDIYTDLVGVGNPIRRDDSVGIFIVSKLKRKLGSRPNKFVRIRDPSVSSERLLSKLDGKSVIIFDAIEHNSEPGSIFIVRLEESRFGFFATHNIPLKLVPGLSTNLQNAFVLGIQPEDVGVGEGLSKTVLHSANGIVDKLTQIIGEMS
jgi:hydrogenase 3 maturation protease